jgi:hypothetical protein
MQQLRSWDTDKDGRVSPAEFEAASKQLPAGTEFKQADADGDGFYTLKDRRNLSKPLVDAIEAGDIDTFLPWLQRTAGVAVPEPMSEWLKDHFKQPAMWDLLQKLSMPVGLFQGEIDANTSAAEVRVLEQKAKAARPRSRHDPVLCHRKALHGLRRDVRVHETIREQPEVRNGGHAGGALLWCRSLVRYS